MNNRIMRRLIWKDIVTIKPLVVAAAIGVVLLNLLVLLIWRVNDGSLEDLVGGAVALWIVMPNFVALGAAAMLVGTEEDNGTMNWLRTLPVGWQQIAAAKMSVATGAVLLIGLLASLVFSLISLRWQFADVSDSSDLLSVQGVLSIAFYTALLMLLGFVTSYVIRPPVMALITLVPIYAAVAIPCAIFAEDFRRADVESALLAGSGVLCVAWLLQRSLARRRLLLPIHSVASRVAAALPATSDYRPSVLPVHSRPSEVVALLWQQLRQTAPLCITLLVGSTLSWTLFCMANRGSVDFVHPIGGIAGLWIMLTASWFGAIVFYGDNVHRRCGFFADRGISPTRVWWTRMLPPTIAFLLLLGWVWLIASTLGNEGWLRVRGIAMHLVSLGTVLFAFGQLVSQWSQRPMLAFFAAPAYAFVSLSPVFYLIGYFGEGIEVIVLVVPVLLFASWRLTSRWLQGDIQRAYTARVIGYTAIAVLVPCLWIASHHFAQLSADMIGQSFHLAVTP